MNLAAHNKQLNPTSTALLVLCFSATLAQNNQLRSGGLAGRYMSMEALQTFMEIRSVSWEQTIPLRHSVLWPTKPPEYCHVEGDDDALHFGAFDNEELVCVASVYVKSDKARLRKFATKASYQNQGIGSKMLKSIIDSLKQTDATVFWCDARESALSFYQRFGMEPYGERFYKADISYFKMKVVL